MVKKVFVIAVFCMFALFPVYAGSMDDSLEEQSLTMTGPWIPDRGNGTYKNPVLYADYSDPDVIRAGEDYYMTSSSFNCTPGLPILHSKDLINWKLIGHVFDQQPPFDVYTVPKTEKGVWAPSIRFHNDTFYILYGDPDYGLYLAKSRKPEGPWDFKSLNTPKGWIDVCPFWDTDGQGYLVHAYAKSIVGYNSILTIRRLSKDASQVTDSIMVIDGNVTSPDLLKTIEGPKLHKKGDYYYIFAPAGGVTDGWQLVLRAKSIQGPWEVKKVLEKGTTAINGPHQGAWITTPDEKESWFIHFQEKGAYGRIVHLQPMTWVNDWPVIGSDSNNDGIGNPVLTANKPNVGAVYPVETPRGSDKFDSNTLGLQWQWYANSKPEWMSLTETKGSLHLTCVALPSATPDYKLVPNLLLQKLCADSFAFTAKVRLHLRGNGEKAGVIVVGGTVALLSVVKKSDGLYITNSATESTTDIKLADSTVYFRIEVAGPNAVCKFRYSTDGKSFTQVGADYTAVKIKWIGAKTGIFATKPNGATSTGYADFAWVNVARHPAQGSYIIPQPGMNGPNPAPAIFIKHCHATGKIAVSFGNRNHSPVTISLYTLSGVKLREYKRSKSSPCIEITLNRHDFCPGVYVCSVKTGSLFKAGKIVVK